MEYWIWLVMGMVLVGFEIFLPSFTALWFGIAALLVGVLVWLMPSLSLSLQLVVWGVISIACTAAWFGYFRGKRTPDLTKAGLSRERLIGETGHVISLPHEHRRGVVRFTTPLLGSDEWDFICEQSVEIGERVTVTDLSGNALLVSKR